MIKNKIKDFLPSIIAVLIALIIGGMIMITKGVNPFTAYTDMMRAAFYQTSPRSPLFSGLAKTLFIATPLIFLFFLLLHLFYPKPLQFFPNTLLQFCHLTPLFLITLLKQAL